MIDNSYINRLLNGHSDFVNKANTAERYYMNKNDVLNSSAFYKNNKANEDNPLKMADNRISHNWHSLLVNQKVGYLFTYPPIFDVGNQKLNNYISETLGDEFNQKNKNIAIDASNSGVGWVHYWIDADTKKFRYERIDPRQVVPVYSTKLESELIGVLRAYTYVDDSGNIKNRCEYWDKEKVKFMEQNSNGLYVSYKFPEVGEEMYHNLGEVPFIPFYNNSLRISDLIMYKDLIDAYDKVYSGFCNDIEDVQEVIFVLKNYGGTDKTQFVQELKKSKVISVDEDGGVDTIRAEIPYEARKTFLETTRKQMFTSGMGVDPDIEKIGNTSGVALEFMYSLLELKAGLMETEFRPGYSKLIKAICRAGGKPEPKTVIQTWTRNATRNDLETSQIASQSKGIISNKSILKNHPWVDDAEKEMEQIAKEQEDEAEIQKIKFGVVDNNPDSGLNYDEE